jgi:hypothetical protein
MRVPAVSANRLSSPGIKLSGYIRNGYKKAKKHKSHFVGGLLDFALFVTVSH